MMHAFALMAGVLPTINRIFEPVTLADQVGNAPLLIYGTFFFSLAAAYLALWWTAPDFLVFRNMGAFLLLVGVQVITVYFGGSGFQWAEICWTSALLVMIGGEAMRVPNRRWALLIWPLCLFIFFFGWFPAFQPLRDLPVNASQVFLCVLIFQGFRHGQRRERQIAAAFAFLVCVRWTLSPTYQAITHLPRAFYLGQWRWTLNPISLILLATATLAFYVRDLIEDRREKQRLAAELEAARTVQQVLIPEDIPSVPGFVLQSVYKPAGQVGGDFFQIVAVKGGGVLAVIGDVSGKGMPAAMTVSLLVGTVRTLAHYTQSPGEILAAMNQRMLGRSRGGFTTCLVLRADADGTLTVANAGHIAPYLAGKELPLQNGLPLGIAADSTYAESNFQLAPGEQLTLLTDGVVEARDKAGALFGFERSAAISGKSADQIAKTAELFGQDDDITVLTLACTA